MNYPRGQLYHQLQVPCAEQLVPAMVSSTGVLCLRGAGAPAGRSRGSRGAWHLSSCERGSMRR